MCLWNINARGSNNVQTAILRVKVMVNIKIVVGLSVLFVRYYLPLWSTTLGIYPTLSCYSKKLLYLTSFSELCALIYFSLFSFLKNTNNYLFQANNQNPSIKFRSGGLQIFKIAKLHKFWAVIQHGGQHWWCDVSMGKHLSLSLICFKRCAEGYFFPLQTGQIWDARIPFWMDTMSVQICYFCLQVMHMQSHAIYLGRWSRKWFGHHLIGFGFFKL